MLARLHIYNVLVSAAPVHYFLLEICSYMYIVMLLSAELVALLSYAHERVGMYFFCEH
jgi:hypothetical protein